MPIAEFKPRAISGADIEIYGEGSIGDKAGQLAEKTPTLREIGFQTPRRVVLAEGFFDEFFQRNKLGANLRDTEPSSVVAARIRRGHISLDEFSFLQDLAASFGESPLVVRSSATGDARGTGIYETRFSDNAIGPFKRALRSVLASYFSESAIAFRQDARTGEGFAIMVEPLIGQRIKPDLYDIYPEDYREDQTMIAPILSGFGYTSTSRGESYVNVVPGIGGGVETKDGETLTRDKLESYDGNLSEYISRQRDRLGFGGTINRSALVGSMNSAHLYNFDGRAYFPPARYKHLKREGFVSETSTNFSRDLRMSYHEVNLNTLFDKMQQMEQRFGGPQYFEWAMTLDGDEQKYWMVQIADVDKKLDIFDFNDFGQPFLEGHTVVGSGIFETDMVVGCMDGLQLDALHEFNQSHKGYVLFYTGDLTSRGQNVRRHYLNTRELTYADVNNASVLIEWGEAGHNDHPLAHFGGQLDMTGKLFTQMSFDPYDFEFWDKWSNFWDGQDRQEGLRVVNKKIKVIGSERQNRSGVYLGE